MQILFVTFCKVLTIFKILSVYLNINPLNVQTENSTWLTEVMECYNVIINPLGAKHMSITNLTPVLGSRLFVLIYIDDCELIRSGWVFNL